LLGSRSMKMVSHTPGAHDALIGLRLDSLNVNK
jgi:hypothetical protein